jgi:hypothetical protein
MIVLTRKPLERRLISDQIPTSLRTMTSPPTPSAPSHLTSEFMPRFDPDKHLIFEAPPTILSMKHFGFANDVGVSPAAVTLPFPLFSPEAIRVMRSEIAKPEVKRGYQFSSNIANSQLRGYARDHAPFTYAAWNHPATVALVSKLAGIELVPWGDYEIAHINLSAPTARTPSLLEKGVPIVDWHTDSYPFVCVLMLSDCTDMIGGETALRTANGEQVRIRCPTEGCAVILQGRYVTHQALRALDAKERITSVTSWRPRSPLVKDDSTLRTVRPVSDLNELYPDFAQYRLDIIKQRIEHVQTAMRTSRRAGTKFDTLGFKAFLQDSIDFLVCTNDELVLEEDVSQGVVATADIPDIVISDSCESTM